MIMSSTGRSMNDDAWIIQRKKRKNSPKNNTNSIDNQDFIPLNDSFMRTASIPCNNYSTSNSSSSHHLSNTAPNIDFTVRSESMSKKINSPNTKKWPKLRASTTSIITCCDCNRIYPINTNGNLLRRNNPSSSQPLFTCAYSCLNHSTPLPYNLHHEMDIAIDDTNLINQISSQEMNVETNNINQIDSVEIINEIHLPAVLVDILPEVPNSLIRFDLSSSFPPHWTSETSLIDLDLTTDFPLFKLLGPRINYVPDHCKDLIIELYITYLNNIKQEDTIYNWKSFMLVTVILFTKPTNGSPVTAQLKEKIRLLQSNNIKDFKIKHFSGFSSPKTNTKAKQDPYYQQIKRMNKYLADGFIGQAAKALVSDDSIDDTASNVDYFKKLHPL